ncbi:ABC transporter permease [Dysosmobacter sp.]|uniref:ABC transporter permease n=1 Tax=Dysosmobacter sp. TaxID=2591382 RepID=UPI001BB4756E|nr:ABC transporter permease [Dysosmobacter sp.]MCI6054788.1 ABC transporter permease subunit [Dysosmobacter sp.]MDY5510893.1 ABC transporter permease [Dysosmobacter sp.]QUO36743.1 ABC transporter permease subunit [Dysosmobacter sp. Marseille-Q4140]
MTAIYKREVASYFNSMTGWLFTAVLTVFIGIYFFVYNLFNGYPYFSMSLSYTLFVFMVVVPILTMRSMAEERRSRTDQLLLTAPVSVTGVVMGKYLAMLTVFALPTAIACLCPLIIALNGSSFLLADYGTILAFFLLGAVEIAVGLLVSALTESQLIAAVGTFGILLVLYLWDGLVSFLPTSASGSLLGLLAALILVCFLLNALSDNWKITAGTLAVGAAVIAGFYIKDSSAFAGLLPDVLGKFSLITAFDSFASDHVFDLRGVLLYLSLCALLVFLTVQVVQKRRWN